MLVAGVLGVDSDTGSVGILVVCGLLAAVWCTKMWSKIGEVGTWGFGMGVHTCVGCSVGLEKGLQHYAGIGFANNGLGMVETGGSVALDDGLEMIEIGGSAAI